MNGQKTITSFVAVRMVQASLTQQLQLWPKDRIRAEVRKVIRAGKCELAYPGVLTIHLRAEQNWVLGETVTTLVAAHAQEEKTP